jgi:hypothetical protein
MSKKINARANQPAKPPEPAESPQGHLSIKTLGEYHRRLLSPQASGRVRSHVVQCSACRTLLLDLARFLDDAQGAGRLTAEEVEEARRKLEIRTRAGAR